MKVNWNLFFHLLAQILAQTAVASLVPPGLSEKIFAAAVAIVGVIVAYYDISFGTTNSTPTVPTNPPVDIPPAPPVA